MSFPNAVVLFMVSNSFNVLEQVDSRKAGYVVSASQLSVLMADYIHSC